MPTVAELHAMDNDALCDVLVHGHPIDPNELADRDYRGVSLGVWEVVKRLSWTKFRKSFYRDPTTQALRGWNVRMQQNGLEGPDLPVLRRGVPLTFGHYAVVPTRGYAMPRRKGAPVFCHRGLMLDYGLGRGNPPHLRSLRDPIVAVQPGDASLLLGWTYLDLGIARVPTPSFFTLERTGPISHVPK
ncbi:MAG: hypothetical protein AAGE52_26460 [Myxococcota bacterium]